MEQEEGEGSSSFVETNVAVNGDVERRELSPAGKGKGLRKWRRIKRDVIREGTPEKPSNRPLKRGSLVAETNIPRSSPDGFRNSQAESNDDNNNNNNNTGDLPTHSGLDSSAAAPVHPELAEFLASGVRFSFGAADSDNSEERSSKSSTAASAPRQKHESFEARRLGHRRGSSIGKGRRGKDEQDTNKKIRDGDAESAKKTSRSSIDSDMRSANVGFSQSNNEGNAREFADYRVEYSDEAQITGVLQAGYYKQNGRVGEEQPTGITEDENLLSNRDQNPFEKSLSLLQKAQEALEKELEKFEEIGKCTISVMDDSKESYIEEIEEQDSPLLDTKISCLNKKAKFLEGELQEASTSMKTDELKVLDLEELLNVTQLPSNRTGAKDPILQSRYKEMEMEFEDLLRRNLEIEIECLILSNAIKTWRVSADQQFRCLEKQTSLSGEYRQLALKLRNTEDKVVTLRKKSDELEASCEELVGNDGVFVLQTRLCKSSLCFFLQVVMFFSALWLFIFRLLSFPSDAEVVPT